MTGNVTLKFSFLSFKNTIISQKYINLLGQSYIRKCNNIEDFSIQSFQSNTFHIQITLFKPRKRKIPMILMIEEGREKDRGSKICSSIYSIV